MTALGDQVVIELRGARLGYPETTVLGRVDLIVRAGETLAVLGTSGSGKTTLLQTILGLIPPLAGEIELFGQLVGDLDHLERERLFSRIGVVFQHNALFSDMTVADNLAVVARQQSDLGEAIVRELVGLRLRSVGLEGFENRSPAQLSGGQRKRLAFARAIVLEPEILFCDEPTSGLDPLTGSRLAGLIRELAGALGATMFMITHDVDLIRAVATRVLVLDGGRIHADGQLVDLLHSRDPIVSGLLRPDTAGSATG